MKGALPYHNSVPRGLFPESPFVSSAVHQDADRQLPEGGEIFLDHVGHFVRDPAAASEALRRAGFAPTPVSVQSNPDGSPTGTGNVTAMLRRGYIEVLFKTADTPLGLEFEASLSGHAGVHLVAFAIDDAEATHARLRQARFPMRPLVQFQRPVETEAGPDAAAFTVVRLERGAMAEGRVQLLRHRTEHTVWQKRWLAHPNGADALLDLVVACADLDEAAERFSRFSGRAAESTESGRRLRLDRGEVQLVAGQTFERWFGEVAVPRLPFMGAYALRVPSLAAVERIAAASGLASRRDSETLIVPFPAELGLGAWVFTERAGALRWRR